MAPNNIVVLLDICLIICGTNFFFFLLHVCSMHYPCLDSFCCPKTFIVIYLLLTHLVSMTAQYSFYVLKQNVTCQLVQKKKLWLQPHSPQSQSDMQTKVLLPACSYSLTRPFRNKANTLTTDYSTLQSNLIWSYWCYDACMDKPTLVPKSNPVPPLELCFYWFP